VFLADACSPRKYNREIFLGKSNTVTQGKRDCGPIVFEDHVEPDEEVVVGGERKASAEVYKG
jgi:hypothetical protein